MPRRKRLRSRIESSAKAVSDRRGSVERELQEAQRQEALMRGYRGGNWFGWTAPAGTPPDVIAKLNAAFTTVLKDPAVADRIRGLGSEPMPMTPD